jgi:hypothetical protein
VEFITGCEDEMMIKKVRIYINGNVKLTAFSFLPVEFRDEVNQLRFLMNSALLRLKNREWYLETAR